LFGCPKEVNKELEAYGNSLMWPGWMLEGEHNTTTFVPDLAIPECRDGQGLAQVLQVIYMLKIGSIDTRERGWQWPPALPMWQLIHSSLSYIVCRVFYDRDFRCTNWEANGTRYVDPYYPFDNVYHRKMDRRGLRLHRPTFQPNEEDSYLENKHWYHLWNLMFVPIACMYQIQISALAMMYEAWASGNMLALQMIDCPIKPEEECGTLGADNVDRTKYISRQRSEPLRTINFVWRMMVDKLRQRGIVFEDCVNLDMQLRNSVQSPFWDQQGNWWSRPAFVIALENKEPYRDCVFGIYLHTYLVVFVTTMSVLNTGLSPEEIQSWGVQPETPAVQIYALGCSEASATSLEMLFHEHFAGVHFGRHRRMRRGDPVWDATAGPWKLANPTIAVKSTWPRDEPRARLPGGPVASPRDVPLNYREWPCGDDFFTKVRYRTLEAMYGDSRIRPRGGRLPYVLRVAQEHGAWYLIDNPTEAEALARKEGEDATKCWISFLYPWKESFVRPTVTEVGQCVPGGGRALQPQATTQTWGRRQWTYQQQRNYQQQWSDEEWKEWNAWQPEEVTPAATPQGDHGSIASDVPPEDFTPMWARKFLSQRLLGAPEEPHELDNDSEHIQGFPSRLVREISRAAITYHFTYGQGESGKAHSERLRRRIVSYIRKNHAEVLQPTLCKVCAKPSEDDEAVCATCQSFEKRLLEVRRDQGAPGAP
jgi:hypothetical protein